MRRNTFFLVLVLSIVAVAMTAQAWAAEGETDGKTLFTETHKCNMCHAVPAADIEAKTSSDTMKGGDLGGKIDMEFGKLAAFVRKEADLDGESHKKPFKGTDEELQAIVDWLGSLEPPK